MPNEDIDIFRSNIEKLSLHVGDVLVVKGNSANSTFPVAVQLSENCKGVLPAGTPIIVISPDIDLKCLRDCDQETKKKIMNAMGVIK